MFKKTLLVTSLSVLSLSAFAGNTAFEGPYVGASLNLTNLEADVKSSAGSLNFDNDGTNAGLGLNLGYGALFNTFYIGTEVGVRTGNGKADTLGGVATIEGKESWDISLLPGFLLNNSSLVYGRIGMGSVNGKAKVPLAGYSKSDDFDTMIWGLGLQTPFSDTLSGRFEISRTAFEKKYNSTGEKWTGDATTVSLGIQSSF